MRQCEFCMTVLPDQATFCGHCGRAAADITEAPTAVSEYPTAGLNDEDEEEKRRRAALPGLSLLAAADLVMQAPGESVPVVQGTPQVGGVPSVEGTPQISDIPNLHHHKLTTQPNIPSHHHPSQTVPSHHHPSQDISSQPTSHLHTSHKPRPGAGRRAQVLLVTVVAFTLIVAGIIGAGLTIFSPALSLSGSTNVVWGQSIHLHGNHFIPGSIVVLTLDGTEPLYYADREPAIQASSTTNAAANLAMLLPRLSPISTSKNTIVVSANGTFDVTINVSSNWPVGQHTVRAKEQISQRSAVLNFTVQPLGQAPTPTPTLSPTDTPSSTDTPTPVGTLSPTATPIPPTPTPRPPTPTPRPPTPTSTPQPVVRQISSTKTQSQTVDATGSGQTQATMATGTLTFTIHYETSYTYSAGSTFTSSSGVQIAIDTSVNVGPSSSPVTVNAHAVKPGAAGNIPAEAVYQNVNEGDLTITNQAAFTGGQDAQTYTFVQQSDIDGAATSLKNSIQQSAIDDIHQQLQSNEHLVRDPQCTSNVSSDHNADDRVSQVRVTVTTTCQATAST